MATARSLPAVLPSSSVVAVMSRMSSTTCSRVHLGGRGGWAGGGGGMLVTAGRPTDTDHCKASAAWPTDCC